MRQVSRIKKTFCFKWFNAAEVLNRFMLGKGKLLRAHLYQHFRPIAILSFLYFQSL